MSDSVNPEALPELIAQWRDRISVLSLDCFDTLLWRTTHAPTDVFCRIGDEVTIRTRTIAETRARKMRELRTGGAEVDIAEIYREFRGEADPSRVALRVEAELRAERAHCFAFPPTVELIRRAHAAGIRIIVVSDTYLGSDRLRALIKAAAGDDIDAMISAVHASSDHGCGKAAGLFERILPRIGVPASRILHVGDNRHADIAPARELGLNAVHLRQFPIDVEQQLRLEAACASLFDASIRATTPCLQLHRATLSIMESASIDAVEPPGPDEVDEARHEQDARQVGARVLGPILTGFAFWTKARIDTLRLDKPGSKVHPLFLLRDGHMPERVFARLFPEASANLGRIELSRFVAIAATFRSSEDVLRYMSEFGGTGRIDALARQMLFDTTETKGLMLKFGTTAKSEKAFIAHVLKPANLKRLVARSEAFAERLVNYLVRKTGVVAGDTLLLVDLGYAGSVQDRIAPLLRERLEVRVEGCYLALRDVPGWRVDKHGLLDASTADYRSIDALCTYIALLEQLCTIEQPSVIDYDELGNSVRGKNDIKEQQSAIRSLVQGGCMDFVRAHRFVQPSLPESADVDAWRSTVLGCLSRLLFYPQQYELALFDGFEHDVNLGVDDKVELFDPEAARESMRRRGLFYINDNPRQFLPAEIRSTGATTSLALIGIQRFGLDLTHADLFDQSITLSVMLADDTDVSTQTIRAAATHDGYYAAIIPRGDGRFAIGVNLGKTFEWVQIHSAESTRSSSLLAKGDLADAVDCLEQATFESIEKHSNGILRCTDVNAFIFFPPAPTFENRALTLTFRPLSSRAATAPAVSASRNAGPEAITRAPLPAAGTKTRLLATDRT